MKYIASFILMTQSLFFSVNEGYKSSCIKAHCNGPFTLKQYSFHTQETYFNGTGRIAEFPSTGTQKTIEKRMVKYYLYNGGSIDPNSRVETTRTTFNATEIEFELMKCKIGKTIKPMEAWGSDAKICRKLNEELMTSYESDKTGTLFNWGPTYADAPFANHMCVIDWRCMTHKSSIPIHVENKGNNVIFKTYDRKGRAITLCEWDRIKMTGDKCAAEIADEDFHTKIEYNPGKSTRSANVMCFSHTNKTFMCKERDTPAIFEMKCDEYWCIGEDNNILLMIHSDYLKNASTTSKIKEDIDAAASIEDLMKTQRSLLYYSENTAYNLETIQSEMYKLYNIVNKVIISLGKLDDELIPNILNKTGKTTWITRTMFNVCPCFAINMPEGTNCAQNHMYDNGRIKKIETEKEKEMCVTFKEEKSNEIDIYDSKDIYINELSFEPANGTSAEWEGWTWISETKEEFNINNQFVNTFHSDDNIYSQLFDTVSSFGFWGKYKFLLGTTFLTYFNFVALIYLMFKAR